MRIVAVAVLAAMLASSAAYAREDERLDLNPDWVRKPDMGDIDAVWPASAIRKGIGGKAVLGCVITAQGLLEACEILSETPAGEGFGGAALLLAPSFVMKPAMRDGKPATGTVRIPIVFGDPGAPAWGEVKTVSTVSDAVWEKAPTFADMAAAWPDKARGESGHVSLRCSFHEDGALNDCRVLSETPMGQGFGKAARDVAKAKFRLRMSPETAKAIKDATINLPVHFLNPGQAGTAPRAIVKPKWINRINPDAVVRLYPEAAAAAGIASGRGVAECTVATDGRLVDCAPATATPPGLGFSESAVLVAQTMRMNPWSDGGGPVDGVRLKLPVTFNLADEAAPPAKP